jgi:ADP-ribose pyrophosphatase
MIKRRSTPRVLRRTVPFAGPIFRVDRETVRLPSGHVKAMDIVRHRGSVVLVPRPSRDRVILIRQYRHAIRRWIWELPAGSLEPGERPAAAARRECGEEIGLVPGRLKRLGTFYPTPGFCDERMMFFECAALRRPATPLVGDEDEQIVPRIVSIAHAWKLVDRGQIIDMKTVLGLLLIESERGTL